MDAEAPLVIDDLVTLLRQRVQQRRQEGHYPPGLEEGLEAHFKRIVAHNRTPDLTALHEAIAHLDAVPPFSASHIPVESGVPGGAKVHAAVAKVVGRQTQGILEQVQRYAERLNLVVHELLRAVEEPAHVHADLVGQLDAAFERLSAFERGPVSSRGTIADLRRRVEQLEDVERRRQFRPFFTNDSFEQHFRGSSEELMARYRDLAAALRGHAPIVDIGCGRGEFLELLATDGVPSWGVEVDPALVEHCRTHGLDVQLGDALDVLSGADEDSLGAIVLIQVIEHLTPQDVVELIAIAKEKLRPGGKLVMETVNPQSLYVFAHAFYVDPTHTQPIHPAYLDFVVREAGFSAVEIEWRSPPPAQDSLLPEPAAGDGDEIAGVRNENIRRLNELLFAPQDYALIATR